ncbi:helix-turn-helix transcriptional regulator [Bradyrhizobium sp.]|uniref:helix-turn-helix transcriptional regulator n=1 Tax=Bradyrhizobium sp. TaxID=376 RepID=UPI003C4D8C88
MTAQYEHAELKGSSAVSRSTSQPRRGLRRLEAAHYVGISPSTFDRWVEDGALPEPIRRGGVVLWDLRKLDVAFDALSGDAEDANPWDRVLTRQ